MAFLNVVQWIVWKDLVTEIRSRETISSMVFFALIVILIFSFSFSMNQQAAREHLSAPSHMLWLRSVRVPTWIVLVMRGAPI